MSDKTFRPWDPDQQILFPPSISDFVPKGHPAHFIRDVVRNDLDLSAIFARYTERRGQPPYHPALDGTKMKANASKHAAMSYARTKKREPELAQLVAEWMEAARSADEEEDQEHGPDRRGHGERQLSGVARMMAGGCYAQSTAPGFGSPVRCPALSSGGHRRRG